MSANGVRAINRQTDGWLPPLQQVIDVLQFRLDAVVGATRDQQAEPGIEQATDADIAMADANNDPHKATATATSMRQGLGLVLVTALVAGLLPFLINWVIAGRVGTALPLAQMVRTIDLGTNSMAGTPLPMQAWVETAKTIAGLPPRLPGWLAAGLSALGVWLNQPLNWLTFWLVYGLGILIVGKLFGATTTLQRFYAVTSYAYLPLLLTSLQPIPYLGALVTFVAIVWTFVLYVRIVQLLTGLDIGRSVLSVLLPGALVMLIALLALGAFAISLVRMML